MTMKVKPLTESQIQEDIEEIRRNDEARANSHCRLSTGSIDRGVAAVVDRREVDRGGYKTVEIVLCLKGKPALDMWERDPALVHLHY